MKRGEIGIRLSHITGLIAVTISIYYLISERETLSIVAASVYFVLACTTDTFKSKIPNLLNGGLIIAAFALSTASMGLPGFLLSLSGLGLGFGLLLLPYLMGGMGAGDVKALAALGALIGPYDLLHVFVYTGLYGGVIALLHFGFQTDIKERLRKGWLAFRLLIITKDIHSLGASKTSPKTPSIRFPYATAIAFGYYSFILWGGVL